MGEAPKPPAAGGLEGVVAAETVLSDVDGARGRLIIAGSDVEDLAARASFEEVCALLWAGGTTSAQVARDVGRARVAAFERLGHVGDALDAPDAMDALRAATAHVWANDRATAAPTLTGALAVFAAAWARRQAGGQPVAPDPSLSHAADYLRMLRGGAAPTPAEIAGLNAYLVTVIDHGMNASTFSARVVASTQSDPGSAVVAAIGALKGPLHGGAPGPVLDMLDAIGAPGQARAWIEAEIAAGRRIMGMGHRVYRVRDPRAAVLERAIARLETHGHARDQLALARAVESEAERILAERHPDRALKANVEFYTAVLLDALSVPRTLFTATFAVSRVAGWCAHIAEQYATGRLIRPASTYVGPRPPEPARA